MQCIAYSVGGYVEGEPGDYNRVVALDVVQLLAFLQATCATMKWPFLAVCGNCRTQWWKF